MFNLQEQEEEQEEEAAITGHQGIIMRSMASMLLGILVSFFIGSNRVIAVTLATLQSEGDAIYAMSQTMTYLVTVDGERSRKFVDSIALHTP